MGDGTTIEWTDATWNPITGCTKVSPGCKFCYAERLELPLRWRAPRRVFVNSMSDLFHERVPDAFIERVFDVMKRAPHHTFQILTKRADRLLRWSRHRWEPLPPHIWIGVSVESAKYLWRVDRLRQVPARIRFISAEPLLGALTGLELAGIAWVITGGESGGPVDRALVRFSEGVLRPKPEALAWIREIRDMCSTAGVAFFHKQWGGPRPTSGGRTLDGRYWSHYPRQVLSDAETR